MRIEADLGVAAPRRFPLGKVEQPPAEAGALMGRSNGDIVEEPAPVDTLSMLTGGAAPTREYRTRDVVRAIRSAADDDRIKAVVLDLSRFTGAGLVDLEEIGAAMDTVRATRAATSAQPGPPSPARSTSGETTRLSTPASACFLRCSASRDWLRTRSVAC